jgi:signal peptidase I
MRDGILYINGEAAQLTAEAPFEEVYERQGPAGHLPRCANAPVGRAGTCDQGSLYRGAAGRREPFDPEHRGRQPRRQHARVHVPEGHVFVMGDNRDNSVDSRFPQSIGGVGFVPFENLLGRADRVIFSSAGQRMVYFWTWRADRFFEADRLGPWRCRGSLWRFPNGWDTTSRIPTFCAAR